MGKPKNSKTASNTSVNKNSDPRDNYLSTKKEMVVATSEIPMKAVYPMALGGKIVIAEDGKGFYATGDNYVDSPMMDPYRQYHRNSVKIVKTELGFDIKTKENVYSVNI